MHYAIRCKLYCFSPDVLHLSAYSQAGDYNDYESTAPSQCRFVERNMDLKNRFCDLAVPLFHSGTVVVLIDEVPSRCRSRQNAMAILDHPPRMYPSDRFASFV
jgi:hypothetical protein